MSSLIGGDIRALRKGRKLTLQLAAEEIGRSPAWLSLVERGVKTPSIEDLGRIAKLFGINISFFFRSVSRDEAEQGLILRTADRMPIGSVETGLVEELLSPRLDGSFEMIKSTFAPHAASEDLKGGGDREDAGVIISGRVTLIIGDKSFDLKAGDSFQMKGQQYSWRNDGDIPTEVIWVVSPVVY